MCVCEFVSTLQYCSPSDNVPMFLCAQVSTYAQERALAAHIKPSSIKAVIISPLVIFSSSDSPLLTKLISSLFQVPGPNFFKLFPLAITTLIDKFLLLLPLSAFL